ncbi:tail fiber domain-containing protein [Candidatus Zixiibacteriota bacterium]
MRFRNLVCISVVVFSLGAAPVTLADVPQLINYQGILLDSGGQPITNLREVIFAIWDSPTDGDSLWSELRLIPPDDQGRFNVLLGIGSAIPDSAFRNNAYLSVKVGLDPEMAPRSRVVSVGYSYRVGTVDGAAGGEINGTVSLPDPTGDTLVLDPDQIVIRGAGGDEEAVYSSSGMDLYTDDAASKAQARDPQALQQRVELNDDSLIFYDATGTPKIKITNTGGTPQVVVGDPANSYTLPQQDGNPGEYLATDGGGTVDWAAPSAGVGWSKTGNNWLYTTSLNDSVGIGTSSPDEKLEVVGNIQASGTITSGSSIIINGTTNEITSTSGSISFNDENLTTTGKVTFGPGNTNSGTDAFVAGSGNTASGNYSTVAGGENNTASGHHGTIGGGEDNVSGYLHTTVSGGIQNTVTGGSSFQSSIGGGAGNDITGGNSVISGGYFNTITTGQSTIGGGHANEIAAVSSTIGGGGYNYAWGQYCTIGGGGGTTAADSNSASGEYAVIGGGRQNVTDGVGTVVAGGMANQATNDRATVGGGYVNVADGALATITGGYLNTASGDYSSIAGGRANDIGGSYSSTSGGFQHLVDGVYSAVLGGRQDTITASADYCMAFGYQVYLDTAYCVALFDSTNFGRLGINRDDHDGGIQYPIHVGTSARNGNGAHLTYAGQWVGASSRTFKEGFQPLEAADLLAKLAALPVESWRYKGTNEYHIGPVAEDFAATFNIGALRPDGTLENKYLSSSDVAGVALAAVKELHQTQQELKEKVERIEQLEKQMAQMQAMLSKLIEE